MKYWTMANPGRGGWQAWAPPYPAARPFDIELNAYALLTYVYKGDLVEANSVARWIISQQNPYGGFSSTQVSVPVIIFLSYCLDQTVTSVH